MIPGFDGLFRLIPRPTDEDEDKDEDCGEGGVEMHGEGKLPFRENPA